MDTKLLGTVFIATWMLCLSAPAFCQMADGFAAAAQKFDAAAAQCQNPAGAACLRQNAEWNRCWVRALSPTGAQCDPNPPSCSTSCSGGVASSSGSNGNAIGGSRASPAATIAQSIGTIQQLIEARNAKREARRAAEQTQEDDSASDLANSIAEAQAAAASAQAQQQKLNSDAANLLAQSNSLSASLNASPSSSGAPDANSTVTGLLDASSSSSDGASTVTALLDSSGAQMGATVNTSTSTRDTQSSPSFLQVPQGIPAIASIDGEEEAHAEFLGPDWHSGIESLRDKATDWALDKAQDQAIKAMGEEDPLEKGINDSVRSQMGVPEDVPNVTLGSLIKSAAINAASDKAADAISDAKDNLACSGATSAVDHWGCMVLLTPTNVGLRGYWAEGKLMIERFGKLMDATNSKLNSGAK